MVKLALSFFLQAAKLPIIFCLINAKRNVELYFNADMIIFKHANDLRCYLKKARTANVSVGFVPTMGALHRGHLSLIEECKKKSEITVCSIFVNATQFNNPDDFKKYPITIEQDIAFLEQHGCDILFKPDEPEIYPDEDSKAKKYEIGFLETVLEGKFRPGHFQGVCLVVEKLLNIIEPDFIFIGQKDFQQCMVIQRLIRIMQKKIEIVICPTLREADGLAMSSRNLRLTPHERKLAPQLYESLQFIKNNLSNSNFTQLRSNAISRLEQNGFKVDYLELATTKELQPVTEFSAKADLVILIAAFLNDVRLIDNILIN